MEPAAWGFIGSLFGAVVGASASVLTTAINTRHSFKLQAASKEWEKAAKFSSYQHETLLAVQSAVQNLTRVAAKAHSQDRRSYAQTGKWAQGTLGKELNEELGEANRVLSTIVERVADNELRGKVKQLHGTITDVCLAVSHEDAYAKFLKTGREYDEVMQHLGSTLRNLY